MILLSVQARLFHIPPRKKEKMVRAHSSDGMLRFFSFGPSAGHHVSIAPSHLRSGRTYIEHPSVRNDNSKKNIRKNIHITER